jgi:hypothetical protein
VLRLRVGADLTSGSRSKRIFCKPCLDWSERRYHLAGWVGVEICRCCVDLGWIVRERDTRAVRLTSVGQAGLSALFGIASLETSFVHPKSKSVSAINATERHDADNRIALFGSTRRFRAPP